MTKQIKIEELIPFMNPGWVAMDRDGTWRHFSKKPERCLCCYWWTGRHCDTDLSIFNIAPAEDWTKSLIKIERK